MVSQSKMSCIVNCQGVSSLKSGCGRAELRKMGSRGLCGGNQVFGVGTLFSEERSIPSWASYNDDYHADNMEMVLIVSRR